MSHVCLSYAHQDAGFARQLAVQLQQRGFVLRPITTPTGPDDPSASSRDRDLETSSHVLLILSPDYIASPDKSREWALCLQQKKHAFVIIHRACDIPPDLADCYQINFQGQFLMAVEELVKRLNKTKAPTRPLTVEHPPPVVKTELLPARLPAEHCWREDRLRINYNMPIILSGPELEERLLPFLDQAGFVVVNSGSKTVKAVRDRRYRLFDPRRVNHSLTIKPRKGSLRAYYRMTRSQVFFWYRVHYRVLDREAAALYRWLATGEMDGLFEPVDSQARVAQLLSWSSLVLFALVSVLLLLLVVL
ncbi:MAG: toll/interleukin-1 receptor domain-containing protein [Anaerolineae bacterium]|nr:toll/interleukin-1 receptor domain-containing protein [Anaerolineae bacterium]